MLSTAPLPLVIGAEPTPQPRPISRQIACMAGFFANRLQAQAVREALVGLPGVDPQCCAQLGPPDARQARFLALSRRWAAPWQPNLKPPRSPLFRRAGQSLLLATVAAFLWWWQADATRFDAAMVPLVWTSLAAAAALGAGLLAWGGGWREPRRPRRFDREVRQALGADQWVVVVHGVGWNDQQAALELLRQGALGWCAEPAPGGRL